MADDALRGDLANATDPAKGAALVGYKHATAAAIFRTVPIPANYGIVGNGSNETQAINAYLADMAAIGYPARFERGAVYGFDGLVIPAGAILEGHGAEFKALGNTSTYTFNIGEHACVEDFLVTTDRTNIGSMMMQVGASLKGGRIISSLPAIDGTLFIHPSAAYIDCEAVNVDRPFHVQNRTNVLAGGTGLNGRLKAQNYIRALRIDAADDWNLELDFSGKSPDANFEPAHNGVLINGCQRFRIPRASIADSGEHAIRFGGDIDRESTDWFFGDVRTKRTGGCSFKINPGNTFPTRRGHVDTLISEDAGYNTAGRNREFIRLSGCQDISFGYGSHRCIETSLLTCAVQLNGTENVRINHISIDNCGEFVRFVDEGDGPGDVTGLQILDGSAQCSATAAIQIQKTSYNVGDVYIRATLSGSYTYYAQGASDGTTKLNGPVFLDVCARGGAAQRYFLETDDVQVRVRVGARIYEGHVTGRIASYRATGTPVFDPGNVPESSMTTVLTSPDSVAGPGSFGSALEFARPGSTRRGAAVAMEQISTFAPYTGLSVWAGGDQTPTSAMRKIGTFRYDGFLELTYVGGGLIMPDANGNKYRVTIANGALSVNPI
ncbi:hypothetical protein [Bordetella muralis]|uniref:hypothetical protein n=1 Tax=Bordetella muralis TaxID=1649130 RepID=UPI0039F0F4DD